MNKKFSTLLASVLLTSAFTVNAQELKVGDFVRLGGTKSITVKMDANSNPTGELIVKSSSITSLEGTTDAQVLASLKSAQAQVWKVAKVTTLASGAKSYQFINKLTNEYLAVDLGQATDDGAAVKLSATGNKDWVWDNTGNLFIYNQSKDSTFVLAGGANAGDAVTLKRNQHVSTAGATAYAAADNSGFKTTLNAQQFNVLMSYPGNDGKLHFNGENVSDGNANILKDTKWKAVADETGADKPFYLLNGKETSDIKNPYLLMVDTAKYAGGEYYKLVADTLALEAEDAAKIAILKGGEGQFKAADNYKPAKVNKYNRLAETAQFQASYSFLNDSISLTTNAPKLQAFTSDITDGTKVYASGSALNQLTSGDADPRNMPGYGAVSPGDAPVDMLNLCVAVINWYDVAKTADQSTIALSFAETGFNADRTLNNAGGTKAKDSNGFLGKAKAYIESDAGKAHAKIDEFKKFIAAAENLQRTESIASPTVYFMPGYAQPANVEDSKTVAIKQLANTKVLTVGASASIRNSYIVPLIQPYVSAPTGDAEITANAGLFFMQVKNYDNKLRATTTQYVVSNTDATTSLIDVVDEANPNAQWVFVPNAAGSYQILNRATKYPFYSGMVQKVKDEAGNVVENTYVIGVDTLKLAEVKVNSNNVYTENKKQYDYSGYFYAGPQNGKIMSFEISPVSPFMSSLALQVNDDKNAILGDADEAPIWYFDEVAGTTYGVEIAGLPQLKSVGYKIYMEEDGAKKYLKIDGAKVSATADKDGATALYFRSVVNNTYIITDVTPTNKLTINPNLDQPNIEVIGVNALKNDYFTVGKSTANKYRTLTAEDGVNGNAAIYLNNEDSRYLYENTANIVANNGTKLAKDSLNFLGIFNAFELDKNPTVYVDTAYVEREGNIMPQYMFALGVTDVEAHAAIPCTEGGVHIDKDGKPTTADKCVHATPATAGYKAGRYLVVLTDSTENKSAKYDGATRLAFVPAKHYYGVDSLVIDDSKWTGSTKVIEEGKETTYASKDTIKIENNKLKAATFALLIKDQADQSFYLETADGYVRILNGVPVLTASKEDAAIFNIEASELEATANEAIEAAGVQVIGGKGAVTVQGAAGKVITVANVLGQTIANQVAASDNVTIAVPAGIVVVAVEGEATKVVVK